MPLKYAHLWNLQEVAMETEAMKELRAIKDAIAREYKSVRALCEALMAKQRVAIQPT